MKKIGIIILIFKRLYIHVNSKKRKKIKSENKSEFRNIENRNSYDEKIQIQ